MTPQRKEPAPGQRAKRKPRKPPSTTGFSDDELTHAKPGLESPLHHVALMYKGRDNRLAQELSRHLRPSVVQAMGIYRRK